MLRKKLRYTYMQTVIDFRNFCPFLIFLGGVFIATLFGLALAMITLAGEVVYYRRKRNNKTVVEPSKEKTLNQRSIMFENPPKSITIGTTFEPVLKNRARVSHISLYPRSRNRLTDVN